MKMKNYIIDTISALLALLSITITITILLSKSPPINYKMDDGDVYLSYY